jgi:hypothetical protein
MTAVNVPDDVLSRAMAAGHTQSAEEAVVQALEEFARRREQADLIQFLGTFEDFMTPEELQQMREMD